jgi:hypothetical protein
MKRICNSLHEAGYKVTLVGKRHINGAAIANELFVQKRLLIFFKKGPGFYIEYNIRLFFYLLFKKCDCICAIDIDTILPVYLAAALKNKQKVYDAHEYFSQQKEIISRPNIYKIWYWIESVFVPKFKHGYTVSKHIADEFENIYGVNFEVIRNMPLHHPFDDILKKEKNIFYQGAVNEARGFEFLIPAMQHVDAKLIIYGDGNFITQSKDLIVKYNLQKKVIFKGNLIPAELNKITSEAYIGINLIENVGLNQYYSLANKFFDYIQHGVPQVTMNFPEYSKINSKFNVALLMDDLQPHTISSTLTTLLNDDKLYAQLKSNCFLAAKELCWQNEEKKLLAFYKNIFG